MKNLFVIVILVLVAIVAGVYLLTSNKSPEAQTQSATISGQSLDNMGSTPPQSSPQTSPSVSPTSIKEFTVTGSNYSFSPNNLTVNKGDTVKITFKNSGGSHDLVIDQFNTSTKVTSSGQSEAIQFVADKSGTYEFYCSVANHRLMGMKGSLIVN